MYWSFTFRLEEKEGNFWDRNIQKNILKHFDKAGMLYQHNCTSDNVRHSLTPEEFVDEMNRMFNHKTHPKYTLVDKREITEKEYENYCEAEEKLAQEEVNSIRGIK